ncbi:MAG: hypothetical protein IJD91_07960 [Clostridia bacterium]|nr:hypothetical protein [Clostridia bacterium]
MKCGKISSNLALASCDASVAGLEKTIILANYDEIDRKATQVAGGVCSEFIMKDGATAYEYTSEKNAFEGNSPLAKKTYRNMFDHSVLCRVFNKTQQVKTELNELANGKVVAIVKNVDVHNDETKYEIYGYESGLEMSALDAPTTDADGVIYNFTLASGDNAKESQLPLSFYAGSLEETEAAIKALVKA